MRRLAFYIDFSFSKCALKSFDIMKLRYTYLIEQKFIKEADQYAEVSKAFTSNRHDFHEGGLNNKKRKMFEGKLGEKAVKMFFLDNNISFLEDNSPHYQRDEYDFMLIKKNQKITIDVKTRTENFHIRTLEMVEQAKNHPKDIFISVRLFKGKYKVKLLGWFTYKDMITKNQIENQGYLDNYVMYDKDLRPMEDFDKILSNFKK